MYSFYSSFPFSKGSLDRCVTREGGIPCFKCPITARFDVQEEEEARRLELEAAERRRLELSAAASFHLTPDETELQVEILTIAIPSSLTHLTDRQFSRQTDSLADRQTV